VRDLHSLLLAGLPGAPLSLCTCCRQYPGAAAGRNPRSSHPAAFPDSAVGSACTSTFSRLARRSHTLRPAHSPGHQVVTAIRGLQPFRYLHDCSDCFRLERIAGWALHPLESAAFSRRTPIAAVRSAPLDRDVRRSRDVCGRAQDRRVADETVIRTRPRTGRRPAHVNSSSRASRLSGRRCRSLR
jgi:hypothetical protein